MKLKFKLQPYQTAAVDAVADCFAGQPGSTVSGRTAAAHGARDGAFEDGFGNAPVVLTEAQVLANIQRVQKQQNLPVSCSLTDFLIADRPSGPVPAPAAYKGHAIAASRFHLDVEMETGTGKTYCYIKTIFELNRRYGWSKFIVMVPTVAIREGVCKSLQVTAGHFSESYAKRARFFGYSSKRLHDLESFASDAGINIMVINVQAFNARGADSRRIYDELDGFQSRKPIDVIAGTRPIVIMDEPQRMEGAATLEALPAFRPLMILRYSATHSVQHNKVYRLDALEAYNQKLVKKIAVRGIQPRGLPGTSAYIHLEGIDVSQNAPVALIELDVMHRSGEIRRRRRRLAGGDDLFVASGRLAPYRGFTIAQIDGGSGTVAFLNGVVLRPGEATGDVSERDIRRIQIRETIRAHLERERQLFSRGIKVLSLFFVDAVARYRNYERADGRGEYARIFEDEYEELKAECLSAKDGGGAAWRKHLAAIAAAATHKGYFSIDRRTNRLKDAAVNARTGESDDADAYDLILQDKERLLSFEEPTRFIFSHSALREGWDNPNIFVLCMLKHSDSTVLRRQEVGRGLRLSVSQSGERVDHPAIVHDINVLTVVASESYGDFVKGLQREMLTDGSFSNGGLQIEDGRRPRPAPRGAGKPLGQEPVHRVAFDSAELVRQCIAALDSGIRVTAPRYIVRAGVQRDALTPTQMREASGFVETQQGSCEESHAAATVPYDLVGQIAGNVGLTRRTTAAILAGMEPGVFARFKQNPEHFITQASRIIAGQKAMLIERQGVCASGRSARLFPRDQGA